MPTLRDPMAASKQAAPALAQEIGPYEIGWKPRKHSWAEAANLLFIDSPVGSGWSHVDKHGSFGASTCQTRLGPPQVKNRTRACDVLSSWGKLPLTLPSLCRRGAPDAAVTEKEPAAPLMRSVPCKRTVGGGSRWSCACSGRARKHLSTAPPGAT